MKRVLRYLKGTTELRIFYKSGGEEKMVAYSDSDYVGDIEDRKSISGYVFLLGSGAVAWSSKKPPVVTPVPRGCMVRVIVGSHMCTKGFLN